MCATSPHELLKYHALQGSMDETKVKNRKNVLILMLARHDDSLMLFHGFWNPSENTGPGVGAKQESYRFTWFFGLWAMNIYIQSIIIHSRCSRILVRYK
jgi:hypothetical protein